MLLLSKIRAIVDEKIEGSDLFLVDLKCSTANEIEVVVDCDGSVSIDSCIVLSKAVEAELDSLNEEFELTVISAGVGQPLRVMRQYQKLMGKMVEVVLFSGIKLVAVLKSASAESMELCYTEKVAVEGKKRKEEVEVVKVFPMGEIKSTCEWLDFK